MSRNKQPAQVVCTIILAALMPLSIADAGNAVVGRWAAEDSVIEITRTGGTLSATIIALDSPVYEPGEAGMPVGAPRRDNANPDESLRSRPILGLEMLSDYRHAKSRWQGKIYDPGSGNTYSSRMHVNDEGNLEMRGYIGVPWLGRTVVWQPLARCTQKMMAMLAKAKLASCGT